MARKKDDNLHEQRRQQILIAAANIFKTKGFHLARTEEICAFAGISSGTVFRYFPDKRSMINAIAEIEYENYKEQLRRILTPEWLKQIGNFTAIELMDLMQPTEYDLGVDSWIELLRDKEYRTLMLSFDAHLRESFARELKRAQAEGLVQKSRDATALSNLVVSLCNGIWFEQGTVTSMDEQALAKGIADLFDNYIFTPDAIRSLK